MRRLGLVAALACCVELVACSTGASVRPAHRPTVRRSDAAGCPTTFDDEKADQASNSPVGASPLSAQLCPYVNGQPLKGRPAGPVTLGAGPAGALADLLNDLRRGRARRGCASRSSLLMTFTYNDRPTATAVLAQGSCSAGTVFVAHQAYRADPTLTGWLTALAGMYAKSAASSAPDLFGLTAARAALRARRAGWRVVVFGEEIDTHTEPGTVLMQNPVAGAAGIGNEIDVLLSTRAAPACNAGDLAVQYVAGGFGTGNDFGVLLIRDVSPHACILLGHLRIAAVDRSGRTIRVTPRMEVRPPDPALILTPHLAALPTHEPAPPGVTAAVVQLTGEERDGPGPNGLCPSADEVTPAAWRVIVGSGSVTAVNYDAKGDNKSLFACLAHFGAVTTYARA